MKFPLIAQTFTAFVLFGAAAAAQPLSFLEACASADEASTIAAGLANPVVALGDYSCYAKLPFAQVAVERFALADPAEAATVAGAGSPDSEDLRARLAHSTRPELQILAQLAGGPPAGRRRVAPLIFEIARRRLTLDAAFSLSDQPAAYFARLADLRFAAAPNATDEIRALDTALELESLNFCHAVAQGQSRGLADLARFRARDLYMVLAYGYTALLNSSYGQDEPADPVFAAIFDRLLLPKLRSEKAALRKLLDDSHEAALDKFTAGALATHRLDSFLALVGPDAAARLARNIDASANPLDNAVALADLIAGTRDAAFLSQLRAIVPTEYARVSSASNARAKALYGLLAASLLASPVAPANLPSALRQAAAPYAHELAAAAALDVAALFGPGRRCVQRYFFWDDDDGVSSFEHFRSQYAHDPAWAVDDRGSYIRIVGHGRDGRTIEIWSNRPINIRLPENRWREGEALRRQTAIDAAMHAAGARSSVLVQRGHSFYVSKTLPFVTPADRLVILGSCRGVGQIRAVMERSHDAQVIATRGKGSTEVNDALLKSLNTTLLNAGPQIDWRKIWNAGGAFRSFLAPSQDPASIFLRAYYLAEASSK